jgi:hypothetical protein
MVSNGSTGTKNSTNITNRAHEPAGWTHTKNYGAGDEKHIGESLTLFDV